MSSGKFIGFGASFSRLSIYDLLSARDAAYVAHDVSTWLLTGLIVGMLGTIMAPRTGYPCLSARLLAFSFDTAFSIEYVCGRHRYVSSTDAPSTAPRGRNAYF